MAIEDQSVEQRGLAGFDSTHDADLQQAILFDQLAKGFVQVFGAVYGVLAQPLCDVFFQLWVVLFHPLMEALV
ncbi:hypothetical protein Q1J68_07755 [Pseudomonas pergaminensis]|uniref:hypothetical protein n=1 Tax=Pseudomonas pergaminensis TaxID=2853159 RepID=UPI0034D51CA8